MIRLIFCTIMLSFACGLKGQEHSFQVEGLDLTWVQVFEQQDSTFSLAKLSVALTDQRSEGDVIYGSFKSAADWKALGYSEMTTPMYVVRTMILAEVVIELKPGRYRVTIKNIRLEQLYDDPISRAGEITYLRTFAVNRNGDFKGAFLKQPVEIYQGTFERLFAPPSSSDDW